MLNWIKSFFGKEEPYSGGSSEAWTAFVKGVMEERRGISTGKDLEAEFIREIDKLSDNLDNVRSLLCKIRRQKSINVDNKENNESGGGTSDLS